MKHHIKPYEIMNHTADLAVRVRGKTLVNLFENAAFTLFDNMAAMQNVQEKCEEKILVEGMDIQELMVNWLNHFLYIRDTRYMIFKRFEIQDMSRTFLEAAAWGEAYQPGRHEWLTDIKAATYHNLRIEEHAGVWTAEILLDI